MKLAILTCQKYPQGVAEDQPLFHALTALGIDFQIHAWDDSVDWSKFDLCLLRSIWDYHEKTTAFNQWIQHAQQVTRILNRPEVVLWNQSKWYLAEMASAGIAIAPTVWLQQNQNFNLKEHLSKRSEQQFFIKPVIGANSSDTLRFENNTTGIQTAQTQLTKNLKTQDMMLQPYLSSVETMGEISAIFFAGEFSHAVRKIPVKGDYRVQDTFGADDIQHQLSAEETSLSTECMAFLQSKFTDILYTRLDFLHDKSGSVCLNEAELIEPSLFFHHNESAATRLVQAITRQL